MTTSIAPRQDRFCRLCGRGANDAHHLLHRSQGGTDHDHNLIDLCRQCHQMVHPEKQGQGWTLEKNNERLIVRDQDGVVLSEIWEKPEWFHASKFFSQMVKLGQGVRMSSRYFKYLDYDELRQAAEYLEELDDESWQAFAELLRVAQLRTPYRKRTEAIDTLASELGIKRSKAFKLIAALEYVEGNPELFHRGGILPSPDAVLLIKASGNAERAMELYQDRAANNPNYGRRQFRQELEGGLMDSTQPPPLIEWHLCPECGANHPKPPKPVFS